MQMFKNTHEFVTTGNNKNIYHKKSDYVGNISINMLQLIKWGQYLGFPIPDFPYRLMFTLTNKQCHYVYNTFDSQLL